MRRKVFMGLAVFIFALTQTPANAAAPKAGAPCSKANQIQTSNGSKFRCVKSGKNLIWKKVANTPSTTMTPTATPATTASPMPMPSATADGYTMEQVRANNTAAKCWSVIDSKVYDLTNWINSHPGGSGAIISLCGTDGTAAFKGQHGGAGAPASRLAGFLLGPLSK